MRAGTGWCVAESSTVIFTRPVSPCANNDATAIAREQGRRVWPEANPERGMYYRSDHWNFAKNNVPIIFYFDGIHEDYHKTSDEVSKIEFDMLAARTKLVFHTAWELANRPGRIQVDKK